MHELSISKSIIDTVTEHITKNEVIEKIIIETGSFSGIDPDNLKFCFDIIKKDTILKEAQIEILEIDTLIKCNKCHEISKINDYFIYCEICNSTDADIIQGDNISLKSIEIRD